MGKRYILVKINNELVIRPQLTMTFLLDNGTTMT